MAQMTTLMVTMLNESKHESKQSRDLLSHHLLDTMNTVAQHDKDISEIKGNIKYASDCYNKVSVNQADIFKRLEAVEVMTKNTNIATAENKQRAVKGNFIISGDMIPPYSPNEDLYQLLFPIIYKKYGICIYLEELKALHRLPNNKVIFSLLTRLPGQNFEHLMRAVNANPEPHIKLYISSQLMPPYSELYYIARRLKHYQVINRYRLDENGNTHIALAEHLMAFKFTGFDQLKQLKVNVPQLLLDEVGRRAAQIRDSEIRSSNMNTQKALQERPNYVPRNTAPPGHSQPPTRPSFAPPSTQRPPQAPGQPTPRFPSVPNPLVPPPNVLRQPPPNLSPSSTSTPTTVQSGQFSVPPNLIHSPVERLQLRPDQNLSHKPPPPPTKQALAQMSADDRPPPPKYQRPSYSPPSFPNPASFRTSPPPGTTPPQLRFPAPSPGSSSTNYQAGRGAHTDRSTHRGTPQKYFGM